MGFGIGLFFVGIGAILAFAVRSGVAGIDIHLVGWILMGVGAANLLFASAYASRRKGLVVTRVVQRDEVAPEETTPEIKREEDVIVAPRTRRWSRRSY